MQAMSDIFLVGICSKIHFVLRAHITYYITLPQDKTNVYDIQYVLSLSSSLNGVCKEIMLLLKFEI